MLHVWNGWHNLVGLIGCLGLHVWWWCLENHQWGTQQTRDPTTPAQHKKKGPNREHWCGADQIPSEGQVRTSRNSRVLEREVNYAYLGWWGYWGFYSSRAWAFPNRIRSIFLLGTSLERDLRDPFLIRIPLDLVKRGEQAISWYVGGKQIFN